MGMKKIVLHAMICLDGCGWTASEAMDKWKTLFAAGRRELGFGGGG